MNKNKIKIGKIVGPVGIKGEVKIYSYSDNLQQFVKLKKMLVEDEFLEIESVRITKNLPIIKFSNTKDRNQAEALRDKLVFIEENSLEQLPEGTYYVKDLIGMDIIDEERKPIGKLTDVIQNRVQDLYEIELMKEDFNDNIEKQILDIEKPKKILLPVVKEFVKNIDMGKNEIIVEIPKGLMEL